MAATLARPTTRSQPAEPASSLAARLRDDGLSLALTLAAFLTVAAAVDAAGWVRDMPSLLGVATVAVAVGYGCARLQLPWPLQYLAGLAIGWVVTVANMALVSPGDGIQERLEAFTASIIGWWTVVQAGGISRDPLPFVYLLVVLTFLIGFSGTWGAFRFHSPWAALLPFGTGLIINLSYTPGRLEVYFYLFLFLGILLAVQMHRANQRHTLTTDGRVDYRSDGLSYFINAAVWSIALVAIVFVIPPGRAAPQLNDLWVSAAGPWSGLEREFERVFGALVPTRASQLHDFGDSFAFRGGIDFGQRGGSSSELNNAVVMIVQSDAPHYWKGRVYSRYGPLGWEGTDAVPEALGWAPSTPLEVWEYRLEIQQTVETGFQTDVLFIAGEPIASSRDARIQVPVSPIASLNLQDPARNRTLQPQLRALAVDLSRSLAVSGQLPQPAEIQAQLPPDLELQQVQTSGNRVTGLAVTRSQPNPPQIVAVRSTNRMGRGERYTITSSVSIAPLDLLQRAGGIYPGWVADAYLDLPSSLPARIIALANEITVNADNPYDKAKAIEGYLRQVPFSLEIQPPPSGQDAVDHFLFVQKAGYSDYHASAMVVLLRSVGIPARLATGYIGGEYDEQRQAYVVRERQGHAWPEVFFPGFGWLEFEPTPALPVIERPLSEEAIRQILGGMTGPTEGDIPEIPIDDLLLLGDLPAGEAAAAAEPAPAWVTPVLLSLMVLLLVVLSLRFIWMRSLAGLSVPQQTYVKVSRLAALGGLGRPDRAETAREYSGRLSSQLPDQAAAIDEISAGYEAAAYGKKDLTATQQLGIESAWRRLRNRLFSRIIRRS